MGTTPAIPAHFAQCEGGKQQRRLRSWFAPYTACQFSSYRSSSANQTRRGSAATTGRFSLREWWVVDYAAASPRDLLDWFLRRRAWSPQATLDEWLYVRRT